MPDNDLHSPGMTVAMSGLGLGVGLGLRGAWRILAPGTPIVDVSNVGRCGIVIDGDVMSESPARTGHYLVVYDNDSTRHRYERTRSDILSADDAYIDRDGVQLAPMTFPEAVRRIHAMAQCNANSVAFGDEGTADQKEWLNTALATVEHLVHHAGATADFGLRPVTARKWPEGMVGSDRDLDPSVPSEALRICIGAAREIELETSVAFERRLMGQAISVAEDLVALYPNRLDAFRPVTSNVRAFQVC
jgi:hypothetical protein